MLEIIQWVILILLGGIVGWVWRSRSSTSTPDWVLGIDEEDLVSQSDLDQYHHRVVQLSHAQRDLLLKKIDLIENRVKEMQSPSKSPSPAPTQQNSPASSTGVEEIEPGEPPSAISFEEPQPLERTETVEQDSIDLAEDSEIEGEEKVEVYSETSEVLDPTLQVLQLWRDGQPIEQIARDLRMGRQEVQLLIEMSRHTPVGAPKG